MVKSYMEKVEVVEKTHPVVNDFMVACPVSFKKTDEVYNVMRELLHYKASGGPVLEEDGSLCGFISEKDCLRLVALNAYHGSRRSEIVDVYMTAHEALTTVTPETGLYKVAQIFLQTPYKKLMVVDGKKLLGMVRRCDVLKAVTP